jgi:hypothetical protein
VDIAHVFAKANAVVTDTGFPVTVQGGTHWPADDPLVLARPDLFTADCRYGLMYSGDPPAYMNQPPDDEEPPARRGPGRPRTRPLVSSHGIGGPA